MGLLVLNDFPNCFLFFCKGNIRFTADLFNYHICLINRQLSVFTDCINNLPHQLDEITQLVEILWCNRSPYLLKFNLSKFIFAVAGLDYITNWYNQLFSKLWGHW